MSRHGALLLFDWLVMLHWYQVVHCAPIDDPKRVPAANRPFVSSYNLSDGSIVDCVNIWDQPTLQDPLFKDHVIKEPPYILAGSKSSAFSEGGKNLVQLFHVEGEPCPHGTIPIQRITKAHVEESKRFQESKRGSRFLKDVQQGRNSSQVITNQSKGTMYASALVDGAYNGGLCRISLWTPVCMDLNDLSYTQMTIMGVDDQGPHRVNTAEVGWITTHVNREPCLYTYWTADKYQQTGCRNLECTGFIQVSGQYVLGNPILTGDGSSAVYEICKEKLDEDWWLRIDDTWVGYFPANLYSKGLLRDNYLSSIEWGGEIYTSTKQPHVQMGNGVLGSKGPDHAVGFRNGDGSTIGLPGNFALLNFMAPPLHSSLTSQPNGFSGQPPSGSALDPWEADAAYAIESNPNYYNTKIINHQQGKPGIAGGTWLFYGGNGEGNPK